MLFSQAMGLSFGNRYLWKLRRLVICLASTIWKKCTHYGDVKMGPMASQIISLTIVPTVYSDADQRKHQSSASLAFVRGIHRGPVNSPHKWPVTRKMFPFDDVIMQNNDVTTWTQFPYYSPVEWPVTDGFSSQRDSDAEFGDSFIACMKTPLNGYVGDFRHHECHVTAMHKSWKHGNGY